MCWLCNTVQDTQQAREQAEPLDPDRDRPATLNTTLAWNRLDCGLPLRLCAEGTCHTWNGRDTRCGIRNTSQPPDWSCRRLSSWTIMHRSLLRGCCPASEPALSLCRGSCGALSMGSNPASDMLASIPPAPAPAPSNPPSPGSGGSGGGGGGG